MNFNDEHDDYGSFEMRDQNAELFGLGKNGRGKDNGRARKDRRARDLVQTELDEIAETAKAIRKFKYDALQSRKGKPGAPGKKRAPYSGGRLGLNPREHGMLLYLVDAGANNPSTNTTFEKLAVMYEILFSKKRLVDLAGRMERAKSATRAPGGKHPARHSVLPITEEDVLIAFRKLDFSESEWNRFDPKHAFEPVGVTQDDKEQYRLRAGIWRSPEDRNPPKKIKEELVVAEPDVVPIIKQVDFSECVWDEININDDVNNEVVAGPILPVKVLFGRVPGKAARKTLRRAVSDGKKFTDFIDVIEPECFGVMVLPKIQVYVDTEDGKRVFEVAAGSILVAKHGSVASFSGRPLNEAYTLRVNDNEGTLRIRGCGLGGGKKKMKPIGSKPRLKNGGNKIKGNGAYNMDGLKKEMKAVAKTALKSLLVGGGGAVGGHAGTYLGNEKWGRNLGRLAGARLSKILGSGDYDINTCPKTNSLVNPKTSGSMQAQFGDNSISVCHREYFFDVVSTSDFSQKQFTINPGNHLMFPFAAQLAQNYEQYRIVGMVITYVPQVSPYTTSSLLGKVIMNVTENPFSPQFRNAIGMENSDFALTIRPDKDAIYGVECARPAVGEYYIRRPDTVVPSGAAGSFDFGTFTVGTVTPGIPEGQILGELWVTYHMIYKIPRLDPSLIGYYHYTSNGATMTSGNMNFNSTTIPTSFGVLAGVVLAGSIFTLPLLPKNTAVTVEIMLRLTTTFTDPINLNVVNLFAYNDIATANASVAVPDTTNIFEVGPNAGQANRYVSITDLLVADSDTAGYFRLDPMVSVGAYAAYYTAEVRITVLNGMAVVPEPGSG